MLLPIQIVILWGNSAASDMQKDQGRYQAGSDTPFRPAVSNAIQRE